MNIQRASRIFVASAVLIASPLVTATAPVSLEGIEEEKYSTVFGDTGSNSVAGSIYAPSEIENPIGGFVDFSFGPGRVAFIQNVPYYLVNPNALAWAGTDPQLILFDKPMRSVTIAVRGTRAGDKPGPNGAFPFTAEDFPPEDTEGFSEARGIVYALDRNNNRIDSAFIENGNLQVEDLVHEIRFKTRRFRSAFYGLEFVNYAAGEDSEKSGIFIGGLGVTPFAKNRGYKY